MRGRPAWLWCLRTLALAVPAPHAPAVLADDEALRLSATHTAPAAAWELGPTAQVKWACGAGQRNAYASECLAAVVAATRGAANGHIKLENSAGVPPGCSHSRVSGRAIFNSGAGQVGSDKKNYQLVCTTVASAADLQCDGPTANAVWLIGTHHKTGSDLNLHLMRGLPAGCKGDKCTTLRKCEKYDESLLECVAAAGGGGIAFTEHTSIPSVGKYADIIAAATESAGSPQLRAAHWVRDPTEVIMSGFFYHKVTDEAWVHEKPGNARAWFAACEVGDGVAQEEACSATTNLGASARLGSYQDLLNALPDKEGVLVEAWRVVTQELADMNATMHVLGAFPKQAITVDLGEAEAECEHVFSLVFEVRRTAPRTRPAAGKRVPPLPAFRDL